ncbi:hypothetical protein GRI34_13170 [Erythrobacter aquimaris]|uniref:Uncharacterized protein n=1 Tax=Qipengyuania aquimaris TaxID=255984 RepID=A0A6I4TNG1_9SPHN|nr:hypothetical protein [Qipengyuania aquimaris]MXO97366.1 hypothetical protein [Qipengyuania aquimaris]
MDNGFNYLRKKALMYFGGGSVVLLLIVVTFFGREPPTSSIAVGTYASECCGSLRLDENSVFVDGLAVPYTMGQSNQGVHVVPAETILIRNGKLTVSPNDHLRTLPLNDREEPSSLQVFDIDTHELVEFVRR